MERYLIQIKTVFYQELENGEALNEVNLRDFKYSLHLKFF